MTWKKSHNPQIEIIKPHKIRATPSRNGVGDASFPHLEPPPPSELAVASGSSMEAEGGEIQKGEKEILYPFPTQYILSKRLASAAIRG